MGKADDLVLGLGVAGLIGVGVYVALSKKNASPDTPATALATKQTTTAKQPAVTTTPNPSPAPTAASATVPAATPAAAAAAQTASADTSSIIPASAGPLAITIGANVAKQVAVSAADKALTKLLGRNIAREAAQKLAARVAKAAVKSGVKAVAKMGVKVGAELAKMGAEAGAEASMGPVGWAALAFDVLSLGLDISDAGGYGNMQTLDALYKQRDGLRKQAASSDPKAPFPFVVGPLTQLSDADAQALFTQVVTDLVSEKMSDAAVDLAGKSDADFDVAMDAKGEELSTYYASDAGFAELFTAACTSKGGSPYSGDCSYPDAATCNSSYKWPIADGSKDIFARWTGDHCESSSLQTLRQTCTDLGLDWDFSEEVCRLTDDYCKRKGTDAKPNPKHNGALDCKVNWAQQGAEAIFGTTITRGLKQVFDPSQYEKCRPDEWDASSLPAPLKAFINVAAASSYMLGPLAPFALAAPSLQYLCFDRAAKCPLGLEGSHGLCYKRCDDSYKSDGATMCYKQYPGWEQNDATTITQVGKVLHANPGKPLSQCAPGQDKEGLLCYDKPKDNYHRIASTAWQNCPDGWKDDGAFWAGHLRQGSRLPLEGRRRRHVHGAICTLHQGQSAGLRECYQIVYPKCRSGFKGGPSCAGLPAARSACLATRGRAQRSRTPWAPTRWCVQMDRPRTARACVTAAVLWTPTGQL